MMSLAAGRVRRAEWLQIQSRTEMHQAEPSLQQVAYGESEWLQIQKCIRLSPPCSSRLSSDKLMAARSDRKGGASWSSLLLALPLRFLLAAKGAAFLGGAARLYEGALLGGRPVGAQQAERALRTARLSSDASGVELGCAWASSSSDACGRGRAGELELRCVRARSSGRAGTASSG
jgi:hypothetical protein